jgi:hypothetical protein
LKTVTLIGSPKPRPVLQETCNTVRRESSINVDLNFKVTAEFKRDFKLYAAANDMSQKDVLIAAFMALKEKSIHTR